MRLKYLLLFVFLCGLQAAGTCFAQDDDFGKQRLFEGRLTFGSAISKVGGDSYIGYHKTGLQAGGMVYIKTSRFFGLSLEMLYVNKGARGGNTEESIYVGTYIDKYYLNLNYVEIPLVAHLILYPWDFECGFSYSRLVKSKEWAEADVPVPIYPAYNYFNKDDYEYVLGVSLRLDKHWLASARYELSSQPIRTWDRIPPRYSQYGVNEFNNVVILRVIYVL